MTSAEQRLIEEASEASGLLDNIDTRLKELLEEQPTLRDRFAMATLTGLLASPHTQGGDDPAVFIPLVSRLVYRMADEMLAARGGAS